MSSPSYSAASPTLLFSDADEVIVYDSEGEEFKCQHQAGAMYWSQLSTVVVGSLGGPRQAKFHPVVPQLAVGDMEGVPPLQPIPQAEVMVEEFARVLAWAQGPLMLEWCQNKAPCVLCAQWGEACIFDVPSMGSQHDTSVCLLCCVSHKKCSILLEWQVACIATEQGWDEDWVWSQLGKAQKTRVLGEGSAGQSAGQVGPPWGGWREGVSLAVDHGKRRASPPSGVGPSKRPQGHEPMVGPPGFHIYSPTLGMPLGWVSSSLEPPPSIMEVFLCKQVEVLMVALTAWEGELRWAREDQDMAWVEKEALEQAWNTSVQVAME
ncbi:hypothetical protein E4T56_gene4556 [Termitomyces sp. T112]|nr:hypothetical protein E4T56_gene4556 [Termitomyces sp. T112]